MLLSFFMYHYVALAGHFVFISSLLLIMGPLGAHAQFDDITFSAVSQCGRFSLNFTGGKLPDALPLTLTIVPLNNTPIFVPIPDSAWNSVASTGAALTFLPIPAGQQFIASLDDADGNPTGASSDIIEVSPSDNTSCLAAGPDTFTSLYTVQGELSQCVPFNLTYNFTTTFPGPTIRAFQPNAESFRVNQSAPGPVLGVSVYTMDALHDTQVVMMFNDSHGYLQVTDVFPVEGNTLSPTDCLPPSDLGLTSDVQSTPTSSDSSPAKLSTVAIIVIAAGGGTLLAAVMIGVIVWFCWRRRQGSTATSAGPQSKWKQLDSERGLGSSSGSALPSEKFARFDDAGSSGAPRPSTSRSPSSLSLLPAPATFWPVVQEAYTDGRVQGSSEIVESDGYVKNPPYTASSFESISASSPRSFASIVNEMPRNRLQRGSASEMGSRPGSGMGEEASDSTSNPFDTDNMSDISSFAMSSGATPTLSKFPTRRSEMPFMSPPAALPSAAVPAAQPQRPVRTASVADSLGSFEIEHILEMAKLYSPEAGIPPLPNPLPASVQSSAPLASAAVSPTTTTGPSTPRSLNTLLMTPYTGQHLQPSRPAPTPPAPAPSSAPPPAPSPAPPSSPFPAIPSEPRPLVFRKLVPPSLTVPSLRSVSSSTTHRGPPLASLPSSPFPGGSGFYPRRAGTDSGLGLDLNGMRRSRIISVAGSEYGGFSEETLEAFQLLRPPVAVVRQPDSGRF